MKTFRKSSLITSVALLLVAIVALGGATFAWFSAKSTAEVKNLSITSSAASGLLVSDDGIEYGSEVDYTSDTDIVLAPASSNFEVVAETEKIAWYSATATDPTNYAATTYSQIEDANLDGYVKHYELYAKTADNATKQLMITATSFNDVGGYGRIAIVQGNTVKMYFMSPTAEGETAVYPIAPGATVSDAYPTTPTTANVTSDTAISLGNITGTATKFDIYIWNEGQDTNCTTLNAGMAISGGFSLGLADALPTT